MSLCVVLEGSPIRGFECYGPFNNEKEAYDWADENPEFGDEWWVMVLDEPSPLRDENKDEDEE